MPAAILTFLASLLGISSGDSLVNKATGIINHASLLALGGWLLANQDKTISFTTSYAFLALCVAVAWALLEVARRSRT